MNLNHPDDDIDLEIKKMNFIEYLISETMSTEYLIEEFGFQFVKAFVLKMVSIPKNHSAYHMVNKANVIKDDLEDLYPPNDYPERWI